MSYGDDCRKVVAGAEELEEAEIAKDLELLAEFVADVAIAGGSGE